MSTVPNQAIRALVQTQRRASQGLWQWCSSRGVLSVLLIVLAAALALSHIFPQIPAQIRSDPSTYQEWLSLAQVQFRGWTSFLEAIGAFYIRDTSWFRVLLAALAFVLLVSGADRMVGLLGNRTVTRADAFFKQPEGTTLSSKLPPELVATRLQQTFERLGLRVRRQEAEGRIHLYGAHRAWASLDTMVIYLGALLVVVSLAMDSRWGWQQPGVYLLPGTPVLLGQQGTHRLELVDVRPRLDEAGIQVGAQQTVELEQGKTTYHRGYYYTLTKQGGQLLQVTASNATGKPLALSEYTVRPEEKSELRFAFGPSTATDETDRLFIVPEEKLVVRLEWLGLGRAPSDPVRFRQWVFEQGGQNLVGETEVETLDSSISTKISGVTYTWTLTHYAVIDAAYQPGRPLLGAGAVLVIAGLFGQMIPRHQVWSVIDSGKPLSIQIHEQSAGAGHRWQEQRSSAWETLRQELERTP